MNSTLVWLRDDLRLADNPALFEAAQLGEPITLLFILDEVSPGIRALGGASRWWLHRSLRALGEEADRLGLQFVLRRGPTEAVLAEVVQELAPSAVLWNRRYALAEREMDARIKATLRAEGIDARSFQGSLLYEPWTVQTGAGKPYTVFTPFYKATLAQLNPREPFPIPSAGSHPSGATAPASDRLEDWNLLPVAPDWAAGLRERWQPGEAGAQARLANFLEHRLERYKGFRDFPAVEATSELSAHLRWGEISPFQIWHATQQAVRLRPELAENATAFIRELVWREFSFNLLYFHPDLATKNFNAKFDPFPWSSADPATLDAWKYGRTGIPLVDAGMRELWHTGYMHNRVRMVAASFLTKNLLIDWRIGEQWFWDTLVDADPANNPASWQWVAGSGADAAPYFRVFNPELQAEKFDGEREYIRRWVPEAVNIEQALVTGYQPIIDLRSSRASALAAYDTLTSRAASAQE